MGIRAESLGYVQFDNIMIADIYDGAFDIWITNSSKPFT